jgi:hypothetical protein
VQAIENIREAMLLAEDGESEAAITKVEEAEEQLRKMKEAIEKEKNLHG